MLRSFIALCAVATSLSCVKVEYLQYQGPQEWPTGAAFVKDVEGMQVYEGLPSQAYTVLGLVDVSSGKPFDNSDARKKIKKHMDESGADALVWLNNRFIKSGALSMAQTKKVAASLEAGRSTQPEVTVIRGNQYEITSSKYVLGSTLLLIRWVK